MNGFVHLKRLNQHYKDDSRVAKIPDILMTASAAMEDGYLIASIPLPRTKEERIVIHACVE